MKNVDIKTEDLGSLGLLRGMELWQSAEDWMYGCPPFHGQASFCICIRSCKLLCLSIYANVRQQWTEGTCASVKKILTSSLFLSLGWRREREGGEKKSLKSDFVSLRFHSRSSVALCIVEGGGGMRRKRWRGGGTEVEIDIRGAEDQLRIWSSGAAASAGSTGTADEPWTHPSRHG